jgi:hypothetical protein
MALRLGFIRLLFLAPIVVQASLAYLDKLSDLDCCGDNEWQALVADENSVFVSDMKSSSSEVKEWSTNDPASSTWDEFASGIANVRVMAIDEAYLYVLQGKDGLTKNRIKKMDRDTHVFSSGLLLSVENPSRMSVSNKWLWVGGTDRKLLQVAKSSLDSVKQTITVPCEETDDQIKGLAPIGDNKIVVACKEDTTLHIYTTGDDWASMSYSESSMAKKIKKGRMAASGTAVFILQDGDLPGLQMYNSVSGSFQTIDITAAGTSAVGGFHVDTSHLYFANGDDDTSKPRIHQVGWTSAGGAYLGAVDVAGSAVTDSIEVLAGQTSGGTYLFAVLLKNNANDEFHRFRKTTNAHTDAPTDTPTATPTDAPTDAPTYSPTASPTSTPTAKPTLLSNCELSKDIPIGCNIAAWPWFVASSTTPEGCEVGCSEGSWETKCLGWSWNIYALDTDSGGTGAPGTWCVRILNSMSCVSNNIVCSLLHYMCLL